MLKALAHPTRIKILEMLREGEKCVCEMLPFLHLEQPNVSQHLAILRNSGIVEAEKRGPSVFYRLKNEKLAQILALLDQIILEELKESQKVLKELRRVK
jgi:ArsR family transcriptional regulator